MRRSGISLRSLACVAIVMALGACGTTSRRDAPIPPTMEKDASGRYYLDDGPGPNPPPDIDGIPNAVPRMEPLHRGAARPYTVMGRSYVPMTNLARYKMRGTATWYGRRYHGKPTSSGEIYDMYAMTAAHTTLPIPSYARVTNLANGKSVVVRINDRGPFVGERLIDLSYTAAHKLGLLADGRGLVEVETILPGDASAMAASERAAEKVAVQAVAPAAKPAAGNAGPRAAPREAAPVAVPLAAADVMPVAAPVENPAPPPSPAAAAAEPQQAAASGAYVQFGAFRSRENAETLLARLKQQLGWLANRLQIHPREGLYRVHAGPYSDPAEARQIASRLGDTLSPRPVILRW
ncbi:MAG: septal ring lytic transglycosylase RlpA family protein [Betaproteobacteria bacterium]